MENEYRLLLACAHFTVTAKQEQEIQKLLRAKLDWDILLAAASRHGILYLLHRNLTRHSSLVDDVFLKKLHALVFHGNTQSLFYTGVLLKLIQNFNQNGISVTPFKGPVLSQILYNNPAIRTYGDLDILVHRQDVHRASQFLIRMGYTPELSLNERDVSLYTNTEDNIIFRQNDSQAMVELHWEISGQYTSKFINLDYYEKRLTTITIAGTCISTLSDEDLLIYLCIHGCKHQWTRLEWICCVSELIKSCPEMNWELVLLYSAELKCKRIVLLGLVLAHTLLDVLLPAKIATSIQEDKHLAPLTKQVHSLLFPHLGNKQHHGQENRFSLFHLKVRDNSFDGIRYGMTLLFQPTFQEWQTWPLTSSLTFLYYFYRPLRLGWEWWLKKRSGG
ncbi:MAG: nucleotidyltransferase family protein [Desulfocapsaceae bacterium]|nr:nucleotidyltransferase family protein [Desulfocapsaceae bacterium]